MGVLVQKEQFTAFRSTAHDLSFCCKKDPLIYHKEIWIKQGKGLILAKEGNQRKWTTGPEVGAGEVFVSRTSLNHTLVSVKHLFKISYLLEVFVSRTSLNPTLVSVKHLYKSSYLLEVFVRIHSFFQRAVVPVHSVHLNTDLLHWIVNLRTKYTRNTTIGKKKRKKD